MFNDVVSYLSAIYELKLNCKLNRKKNHPQNLLRESGERAFFISLHILSFEAFDDREKISRDILRELRKIVFGTSTMIVEGWTLKST